MSGETTPAIERAGEAIFGHDDSGEDIVEDVRRGLAAAFDVEEMARVIRAHLAHNTLAANYDYPLGNQTNNDVAKRCAPLIAAAVRTALLGPTP